MKFFLRVYEEFVKYQKEYVVKDIDSWLGRKNLSEKKKEEIFEIYWKPSFTEFWVDVKLLIFSKNPLKILESSTFEPWDLWDIFYLLSFLKERGFISIRKGFIEVTSGKIKRKLLKPLSKDKIKRRLNEVFGKMDWKRSIAENLNLNFWWKDRLDQIPIDLNSAIKIVEKISYWYPFYSDFLLLGDDDFISIILKAVIPKFKLTVFDLDEELLNILKKEGVRVKKIDFTRKKKVGEFFGFYTNPPYTIKGVKEFLMFGKLNLSKLGGTAFVVLGPGVMDKRNVVIQRFLARNSFLFIDSTGPIVYRFLNSYAEDKEVRERLGNLGIKISKNSPSIAARLFVYKVYPWKIREVVKEKDILSYF